MKRLARRLLIAFLPMLILGLSSCTLSPEARRDRYMASGKKLIEKKDYRRAVLEFKNALKAKPRDADTRALQLCALAGSQARPVHGIRQEADREKRLPPRRPGIQERVKG